MGQRSLRVVHEDLEVRRGASQRIPGLGRGACLHRRVPGESLQPKKAALGAGLLATGPVRSAAPQGCRFAAAFCMSFLRHPEIFPSDGGARLAADAPAHRLDEFPAGYSLAGCSPAEPASASPAGHHYAVMSSCRSRSFQRTANCVLTVCLSPGGKGISLAMLDQLRQVEARCCSDEAVFEASGSAAQVPREPLLREVWCWMSRRSEEPRLI